MCCSWQHANSERRARQWSCLFGVPEHDMKQVRAAEPDRIVHLMLLNELTLGSQAAWLHATIGKAYLYRIGLELLQSDGKLGTNRFRQQISEDDLSKGVNSCQIPYQRSM